MSNRRNSSQGNEKKWQAARERALRSIENLSDEEDAKLEAAAKADPDNPPLGESFVKRARRVEDAKPELLKRYVSERRRGQRGPQKSPTKQLVSLRLDRDVVDHFRALGAGWQARINDALRVMAGLGGATKIKTGEICPESGVWQSEATPGTSAPISKGSRMPSQNGRAVSWVLVQAA